MDGDIFHNGNERIMNCYKTVTYRDINIRGTLSKIFQSDF